MSIPVPASLKPEPQSSLIEERTRTFAGLSTNFILSSSNPKTSHINPPSATMKTVLLILDVQNGVIDRLQNTDPYLQRLASTIEAARKANIYIIHVVTSFRPGYPEINHNNPVLAAVAARGEYINGHVSTRVHSAIEPAANEVVVTKNRVSAFYATGLEMILRCAGADAVVVAGLITSGAVLSTVRDAMDRDYRVTVLEDCCMDRDEEVHRVLMEKVFASKTDVISADRWVESLSSTEATEN
jgi:nicotinamidase-related amidase